MFAGRVRHGGRNWAQFEGFAARDQRVRSLTLLSRGAGDWAVWEGVLFVAGVRVSYAHSQATPIIDPLARRSTLSLGYSTAGIPGNMTGSLVLFLIWLSKST